MDAKQEIQLPLRYSVAWSDAEMPSAPTRKELETDLLNAVIGVAEAFGATDVEVDDIQDAPDGSGKVVTLRAHGKLDMESLQSELRRAVDGFE